MPVNQIQTKRRAVILGADGRIRRSKGPKRSWRDHARTILRDQYGDLCCWCGIRMNFGGSSNDPRFATIEHLVRQADGGTDAISNLRVACRKCNNTRH